MSKKALLALFAVCLSVVALIQSSAMAQMTAEQRAALMTEMQQLRREVLKIRREMQQYTRDREPVPKDLKEKNHHLSTRVMELSRQLRDGAKPKDNRPTDTTSPRKSPPDDTTPTATGDVGAAIELARLIVANDKEFEESLEPRARAMLNGDREVIKPAEQRFHKAFANWSSLRRKRTTVALEDLLLECPASFRGDWTNLPRWSDEQLKSFAAWTAQWQQVRIPLNGNVESVRFTSIKSTCKTTMPVKVGGNTIDVPLFIDATSTRVYMLEHAKPGDLIQGEVVITSADPLTRSTDGFTLTLRADLENAEVYRPGAGNAKAERVWPDMNAVANKSNSLWRSYESKNIQGDRLFSQAKLDPALHDQWVQALISYEHTHVRRSRIWHPIVTIEQWMAGCPADSHGPWKTPGTWNSTEKRAFDRWVGRSYNVKLLSKTVVEEEVVKGKYHLRGEVLADGAPISLKFIVRPNRKLPVEVGDTLYATMSLGSYNKWTVVDDRFELTFNANVHRTSATPIDKQGKPVDAAGK